MAPACSPSAAARQRHKQAITAAPDPQRQIRNALLRGAVDGIRRSPSIWSTGRPSVWATGRSSTVGEVPAPRPSAALAAPCHGQTGVPGGACIHCARVCAAGASSACNAATRPARSAVLRFWLSLYLPTNAVSGISMQTIAPNRVAM